MLSEPANSSVATGMGTKRHEVFEKKIPVPTNYRNASKYLRMAVEEGKPISELVANDKHFRGGTKIMGRLLKNIDTVNELYSRIELERREPMLNGWLARVLIAELVYNNGHLLSNSRPVECIRRYQKELQETFNGMDVERPISTAFKEPCYIRVNTNVLNMEGVRRLLESEEWIFVDEKFSNYQQFLERVKKLDMYEYTVDFQFPELLVFHNSAKSHWTQSEHLNDKFLLQNKACLLATYLLKPPKKSVVLDMCAAPGNKTTHLACLMKDKGRLYAVERDEKRYETLCKFTAKFEVIKTIQADCLKVTDEQVPGVQYILLDPSCSGTGMRYRKPEPVLQDRLFRLAGLQYKLLSHAMNAFPNVQRIVYSTCSMEVEENEEVVQSVLRHVGHFRLLNARQQLGKEWLHVGSSKYPGVGEKCLCSRPDVDLMIGMFVAVFERCPEGVENELYQAHEKQKQSYEHFAQKKSRLERAMESKNGNERQIEEEEGNRSGSKLEKNRRNKGFVSDAKSKQENSNEEQIEEEEGNQSVTKLKKKRKNKELTTDASPNQENGIEEQMQEEEGNQSVTKLKKKRKNKEIVADTNPNQENGNEEQIQVEEGNQSVTKLKKKRKNKGLATDASSNQESGIEEQMQEEEGNQSVTKLKKKRKNKEIVADTNPNQENGIEEQMQEEEGNQSVTKLKKKRKNKELATDASPNQENGIEEQMQEEEGNQSVTKLKKKRKNKEIVADTNPNQENGNEE
ncbi:28S rRNA (cytosine-C(5))-methyltransferase [Anopheles nili]|uniref:28S rRNA (cytosine-C(5))-methyltransferase n=1 Tax=Anopheles nili TaxID=185578 RepID=UPI00237B6435|nr:28S rRNA (cytosine-C(5))-methyltransferase [Anopheles nili]